MERTKTYDQIIHQYWRMDTQLRDTEMDVIFDNNLSFEEKEKRVNRLEHLQDIAYGTFLRYTENISGILGVNRLDAMNKAYKRAYDCYIKKGKKVEEAIEYAEFIKNEACKQYESCTFDVSEYTNDNNGDTKIARPLGRFAIVNETRTRSWLSADKFRKTLGNPSVVI